MVIFFVIMQGIRRHYDSVDARAGRSTTSDQVLPTRVHAIVLVSKLHKPTLRALAFAKATRPNVLEAVYVDTDADATDTAAGGVGRAQHRRTAQGAVLAVPRDHPADRRVRRSRSARPTRAAWWRSTSRSTSSGRWWEQLLHNQTALRLKGRLLFTPGVMVTSVPYQLRVVEIATRARGAGARPGPRRRPAPRRRRARPASRGPARTSDAGEPAPPAPDAGPRPRRGSASGSRSRSGRSRTAVTVVARARGPGRLRPARAARASGSSSRSPRAPTATGSGAATPSRCSRPRRTGSPPPCPYAGPGRCGGCDFQHVAPARAARAQGGRGRASSCPGWPGSTWTSTVEAVPGRRRRARLAHPDAVRVDPDGTPACAAPLPRRGPVDDCLIAHPGARGHRHERPTPAVERSCLDRRAARLVTPRRRTSPTDRVLTSRPRPRLRRSPADGFWQVHPGAADALVGRRARGARPAAGGAGARPLRRRRAVRARSSPSAVGPTGRVVAGRGRPRRRRGTPRTNLARPAPGRACVAGRVDRVLAATSTSRSTSSSSTRRARAPAATVVEQDRRTGAARGRVRRLRPGRPGPRRGDLRRARLPARGAARLRPVPDDAPRRVRRAAGPAHRVS